MKPLQQSIVRNKIRRNSHTKATKHCPIVSYTKISQASRINAIITRIMTAKYKRYALLCVTFFLSLTSGYAIASGWELLTKTQNGQEVLYRLKGRSWLNGNIEVETKTLPENARGTIAINCKKYTFKLAGVGSFQQIMPGSIVSMFARKFCD